jgi:BirA family transcriptional regulator, biotin operon repressor / biotin---[acetyl-CoA-carboxylase] ligase
MIGTPRVHLRLTDSTNERAKELAAAGAPHGTLVTADEQSAGRGRQGRAWMAPARSAVLMSLITRRLAPTLPLAAAVAICEALPVRCEIKWPNDIWLERRKLAGILVEGRPQEGWAVLGIGLNVTTEAFPAELGETATSLRLAGIEASTEAVLAGLLDSLGEWLEAPDEAVLAAWRERDALRDEPVRWTGGEGTAEGIDESGGLIVATRSGRVTLDAGEVHLVFTGRGRASSQRVDDQV